MSSIIVPAILTSDHGELTRKIHEAEKWAPAVHLDITDGQYVASTTLSAYEQGQVSVNLPREFHLMVMDWESALEGLELTPNDRVVLPIEFLAEHSELERARDRLGEHLVLGIRPGLVSATDVLVANPAIPCLVLGVEPGYQGGHFLPTAIETLKQVKSQSPHANLTIDGGLVAERIRALKYLNIDRYIVGSAIWQATDPAVAYQELASLI